MFKRSLVLGGLSGLVLFCVPSCSSDKKSCEGAETCACYANGTCNAGLDCRSNVCVNLTGSSGGSTGSSFDSKACLACAETACESAATACEASSGCEKLIACMLDCTADATCLANCAKGVTPDNIAKSGTYQACAFTMCASDCVYVPGGSGGSGNGSAGSNSSAGGSSKAGGSSSAGSSSGGGGGGSPPAELVSGANWLSVIGDAAPASAGVNGKLGIEGVFYAYGDACSTPTMAWDPISRCISGMTCAADAEGTNWGVAIGFDFNNVDSVKHAWNATAVGATGIAWDAFVSSGSMQVWIQNMDPSFAGTCSTMNCNINAPPDGTSSASSDGRFWFANMEKDVWGPGAASYVFDPTNISALQFKLPAKATSASYTLCVDTIGIVRP